MKLIIRREEPRDFREVELLTRKAFWNVYVPGCVEHYLAHCLRNHADFIPELDLVAETAEGKVVASVMYTRARLTDETGREIPALTFGPLSVHPDYQRKGISKILLEASFEKAVELGYRAVIILGNPGNYVSRGFRSCKRYLVCMEGGIYPAAMLVRELVPGTFSGGQWVYQESPAYVIDEAGAEAFDRQFEPMEKKFQPSQEEFYILSHSLIQD